MADNPRQIGDEKMMDTKLNRSGLLGAAAAVALAVSVVSAPSNASAQCVNSGAAPLSGLQSGDVATCSGSAQNVALAGAAGGVEVRIAAGAAFDGGSIILGGTNNRLILDTGALVDSAASIALGGDALFQLAANALVEALPGSIRFDTAAGQSADLVLASANGTPGSNSAAIVGIGAGNGQYLIQGGAGSERVVHHGRLLAAGDGLLMDLGQGDDTLIVRAGAQTGSAGGALANIQGGAGADIIRLEGSASLNAAIGGFETLIVTGAAGDLAVLSGSAQWSQISILSGNLQVTSGTALGGSDIIGGSFGPPPVNLPAASAVSANVAAGSEIRIGDTGIASGSNLNVVNLSVTGDGRLVKLGDVRLLLSGQGTFTGGTRIEDGELVVYSSQALGSGGVSLSLGGLLGLNNVSVANTLSGDGQVNIYGLGVSRLLSSNNFTGGIRAWEGTLEVFNLAALGSGELGVAPSSTFQADLAQDAVFTNPMRVFGTFRKIGAGTLSFADDFAAGQLRIDGGTVRLDRVATTMARIGAAGTLTGTGAIIGGLENAGTLRPHGSATGAFSVTGDYTHQPGGTLVIDASTSGVTDRVTINGRAFLNGGAVRVDVAGTGPMTGGTILTATGGVYGTFADLQVNGTAERLILTYEADRVHVVTADAASLNAQGFTAAYSGFTFIDRLAWATEIQVDGPRVWSEVLGGRSERVSADGRTGFAYEVGGVAGGVNLPMSKLVTIGASFAWTESDMDLLRAGSDGILKGDGNGRQALVLGAFHARFADGPWRATLGGTLGKAEQQTVRQVGFNGVTSEIEGSGEAKLMGVFFDADRTLSQDLHWRVAAQGRVSAMRMAQDGYTERGSNPMRLAVDPQDLDTLQAQLALAGERVFRLRNASGAFTGGRVELRASAGARHYAALDDRVSRVRFANAVGGTTTEIRGDARDFTVGFAKLAADLAFNPGATVSVGVALERGEIDWDEIRIGASFSF